ncbi:MAG: hypothetical protein J7K04_05040 [Spirochaetales bacterium]|nr:hypothetical protein [Spirochaetales bacterium]
MAVEKMNRVSLAFPAEKLEKEQIKVISTGEFEPVRITESLSDKSCSYIKQINENPFDKLYSELMNFLKMTGYNPEFREADVDIRVEVDTEKLLSQIRQLNEKLNNTFEMRNNLKRELENKEKVIPYLDILSDLDINLGDITNFEMVRLLFGRVPERNFEPLIYSSVNVPVLILEVNRDEDNVWVFAFTTPYFLNEAYKILHSAYFTEDSIPEGYSGTPLEIKEKLEARIKLDELQLKEADLEVQKILFSNVDFINSIYTSVLARKRVFDLTRYGGLSGGGSIYFLDGWMTDEKAKDLEKDVDSDTVLISTPGDKLSEDIKKNIPVRLKNSNWFFKPFETITEMYGTPGYNEIDPSPFVAVLFTVMFGFMLGDIGHGLILALIGLFIRKTSKKFGSVIMYAGFSAVFFGFMYGSVFGFEWLPAIFLRPVLKIQELMIIAICFGIGIVSLGLILNIINGFKQRNWEKAVFGGEGIAGALFYLTSVFSVSYYLVTRKIPVPPALLIAALGISLVSIFLAEPLSGLLDGKGLKFPEGFVLVSFVGLFNLLIEYFSNAISFVRLAAFALTHGALFSAFWIMTLMVLPTPGGGLWAAIIFLIGQLILVGLEGLVVFIQDLRLTYYEYFTKFFEGSGHPFKPLKFKA